MLATDEELYLAQSGAPERALEIPAQWRAWDAPERHLRRVSEPAFGDMEE